MSKFDPQGLYIHHQRESHTGQIIQKRPIPEMSALRKHDIQKAINVLTTYGYYVSKDPPPTPPPTPPEPQTIVQHFYESGVYSHNVPLNAPAGGYNCTFNDLVTPLNEHYGAAYQLYDKAISCRIVLGILSIHYKPLYQSGYNSFRFQCPKLGDIGKFDTYSGSPADSIITTYDDQNFAYYTYTPGDKDVSDFKLRYYYTFDKDIYVSKQEFTDVDYLRQLNQQGFIDNNDFIFKLNKLTAWTWLGKMIINFNYIVEIDYEETIE